MEGEGKERKGEKGEGEAVAFTGTSRTVCPRRILANSLILIHRKGIRGGKRNTRTWTDKTT